eukprot:3724825-Prymnesium_polylepis.1
MRRAVHVRQEGDSIGRDGTEGGGLEAQRIAYDPPSLHGEQIHAHAVSIHDPVSTDASDICSVLDRRAINDGQPWDK